MRLRIALIFIAVIIGIVAVVVVVMYISNIRATAEKEVEKIEVLVAVQNIPKDTYVDTLITSKSIELQPIPRKYLADGVLTTLDNYKDYVTVAPISKGEQITSTKFVKPEQIGLAFTIPPDMVAVSIPIDEIRGVSYLINVGDFVNVIATFMPQEQTEEMTAQTQIVTEETVETTETAEFTEEEIIGVKQPITKILLWNVEVLYIGRRIITVEETQEEGKIITTKPKTEEQVKEIKTVTLAVTPEDSEKLIFSEEMGLVWLALLPTDGIQEKETPGRTYENIFGEIMAEEK